MGDPLIISEYEFRLYDLFFAAFSTSLGFGFTIIYWLTGRNKNIKKRYLKTFTIANAWFITFVALMVVTRFGSLLFIVLFSFHGYDHQLDILGEFRYLLILVPIYVFFAQWNAIRLILRTRNWILISIIIFSLSTFYLFKTTDANRDILNNIYYTQNKERFDFINNEFARATKYGIFFSDSTNQILQKKYAERTNNLVIELKHAFNQNKKVSLDTLILEKIVIHNMNTQNIYICQHREEKDRNWSYALPEEIYNQILRNDTNSIETKILFEILHEQISLLTEQKLDWNNCTKHDREKYNYQRNIMHCTDNIQIRLKKAASKLKNDSTYERYWYLIPTKNQNTRYKSFLFPFFYVKNYFHSCAMQRISALKKNNIFQFIYRAF